MFIVVLAQYHPQDFYLRNENVFITRYSFMAFKKIILEDYLLI